METLRFLKTKLRYQPPRNRITGNTKRQVHVTELKKAKRNIEEIKHLTIRSDCRKILKSKTWQLRSGTEKTERKN